MSDSTFPEVRSLDLFADMSDENYAKLMRGAYLQTFPPHVDLIGEGEGADFLHVLVSGAVDLFSRWNNRETSVMIVKPVSTFILAATIRDARYLMSARTMEKSRIVMIPSQDVRAIFDLDAGFARAVVVELAACYRSVIKTTKNLKLRTALERLANYLLSRHRAYGAPASFDLDLEKRQLASVLGMTPENLSRAFKALQAYGVAVNGEKIEITNPALLQKFAKPTSLIDDDQT
ncbi:MULTISPECIES: helix-turn-helix domain-containing protein [Thalassospira]|jgi:CRP/FNR family transcriptional activator FtrB|uniref:Transcriptional regulator n=2 Tax=Thalassospira tepidiphila TaxID=393657 RepID=A0A853L3K6_9PROT|nr:MULTISPECIES: helix-turn-helix domain-containing protein [Thalassospira]KZC99173.1 transcriptional regulator [Thalassospira sp. MCCC 1A02898]MBE72476.1 transcriptional regulator [Thalassospira sp.]MBO6580898.1 helix-turn-helix domain-containing protein [Thalassospira sp.]MBO6817113.1 helix-turn-helix domain-containing protein [Thalassospira sp.]MBO6888325.1 helix-turn-helix domain-containing protein [Thalassospira sp.]|tara:strand:+ start:602 stop:1300 length:699 start_codon:yes stop_codon:yes gene_type:complete